MARKIIRKNDIKKLVVDVASATSTRKSIKKINRELSKLNADQRAIARERLNNAGIVLTKSGNVSSKQPYTKKRLQSKLNQAYKQVQTSARYNNMRDYKYSQVKSQLKKASKSASKNIRDSILIRYNLNLTPKGNISIKGVTDKQIDELITQLDQLKELVNRGVQQQKEREKEFEKLKEQLQEDDEIIRDAIDYLQDRGLLYYKFKKDPTNAEIVDVNERHNKELAKAIEIVKKQRQLNTDIKAYDITDIIKKE